MTVLSAMSRPPQFWVSRYGPAVLGLALAGFGLAGRPSLAVLGAALLSLAGLAAFARANGYRLPHAGYARIVTYGCWDVPLAFAVRRAGRVFLFHRSFDCPTGALPDSYAVYALPGAASEETARYFAFSPEDLGEPLGQVPVGALRFDGSQVARADLDVGLAALGSEAHRALTCAAHVT
jgi:hypothetical protein